MRIPEPAVRGQIVQEGTNAGAPVAHRVPAQGYGLKGAARGRDEVRAVNRQVVRVVPGCRHGAILGDATVSVRLGYNGANAAPWVSIITIAAIARNGA